MQENGPGAVSIGEKAFSFAKKFGTMLHRFLLILFTLIWGRIASAYLAISGQSLHTPIRVRGPFIVRLGLFLSSAFPTLSLICACEQKAVPLSSVSTGSLLRLEFRSTLQPSYGQAELRNASVFLYDSRTGGLDSFQQCQEPDASSPVLLSLSSSREPRTIAVVANLPGKAWEWNEICHLDALSTLPRCSLSDESPEAPVMTGMAETGSGSDESCTVLLEPLLCRIRLRSLRCDFSGRAYPEGTRLERIRCFLVNAPSETSLFPSPGASPPGYLNMGSDCDSGGLPCPELLSATMPEGSAGEEPVFTDLCLYCYPNPSEEDAPGSPRTRLVIQGDMMGQTWYYPINLPPTERGKSYDYHVTITQTGSGDPDTPVDGATVSVGCEVCPWEERGGSQVLPFRKTQVHLSAADPGDDALVSDLGLLVYSAEGGVLLEHRYYSARELPSALSAGISLNLLSPLKYTLVALANLGYDVGPVSSLEELARTRYYLSYPDEYSRGMPMVGLLEDVEAENEGDITIPLERLMARIRLQVDRSGLEEEVGFNIRSVEIGHCPRSVALLGESRAETQRDLFVSGFYKDGSGVDPLNLRSRTGMSDPVELYLLENVQGTLLTPPVDPREKLLPPGAPEAEVCSYVKLHIDYQSADWYSGPDHYLIYRFYLGESGEDFSVRRNGDYHFIIRPERNGLGDGTSTWRIDRSRLGARAPYFELHPAAYNECQSGESFHIWCEVTPSTTPMTIEPLAWDDDIRVEELYSYDIDPDGFGITIHPRKGGTALVYFSAGPPVSRDTLALLRIDP